MSQSAYLGPEIGDSGSGYTLNFGLAWHKDVGCTKEGQSAQGPMGRDPTWRCVGKANSGLRLRPAGR